MFLCLVEEASFHYILCKYNQIETDGQLVIQLKFLDYEKLLLFLVIAFMILSIATVLDVKAKRQNKSSIQ